MVIVFKMMHEPLERFTLEQGGREVRVCLIIIDERTRGKYKQYYNNKLQRNENFKKKVLLTNSSIIQNK